MAGTLEGGRIRWITKEEAVRMYGHKTMDGLRQASAGEYTGIRLEDGSYWIRADANMDLHPVRQALLEARKFINHHEYNPMGAYTLVEVINEALARITPPPNADNAKGEG